MEGKEKVHVRVKGGSEDRMGIAKLRLKLYELFYIGVLAGKSMLYDKKANALTSTL